MKQLVWLLVFIPALAYSQPSLCTVTGTIYTPYGDTARFEAITVVKAVKNGSVISRDTKTYRADKNGAITLLLHRGSTTWLYGEVAGMDSLGKAGVPVAVPDDPTAVLSTLVKAGVPPKYTVLIGSAADTVSSVRVTHPAIPGFSIADLADTNRVMGFDMTGKMVLRWKGGGAAVDTSGAFALLVAQAATITANAALPKADTSQLHAQKFKTFENVDAGKAGADSVQTALQALQNLIGGKGDSDSLATAYAAAQAAFAKADTAQLHAQLFKIGENISAGKANADSIAQQIKLVKDLIAARRDSTTINGVKATSFTIAVPSDSMLINTVTMDSTSMFQGDTVRWSYFSMEYPMMLPRPSAFYGGTKLIGSVGIRFLLGGALIRTATSPYEFVVVADSANGVEILSIYIQAMVVEGTAEDARLQENFLRFNDAAGSAATSETVRILGNNNAFLSYFPYATGTRKSLRVLATSLATNASAASVRMTIFYRQAAGNNYSTWNIKLASF